MSSSPPENAPKFVVTKGMLVGQGIFLTIVAVAIACAVDFFAGTHHLAQLFTALIPYPSVLLYGAVLTIPFFIAGETIWVLRHKFGVAGESSENFISNKISISDSAVFSLFSGLPEEVLFRGVLMPLWGIWASSIAFGLSHCTGERSIPYVIETFLMGVALAFIFAWSGSLWVGIVIHVGNNFLSFTVAGRLRALFGLNA